jgi:hypothetical protein
MRLDAAIEATHIGHTIVQTAFVNVVKRTLLGIINSRYYPAPPVLGFQIVGHIMSTKTLIFWGEPAIRMKRMQDKGFNDNKGNNANNLTVP